MGHSPIPWDCITDETGELFIYGPDGTDPSNGEVYAPLVATITNNGPVDRENAAFIVKACNCHAELLEALKAVETIADWDGEATPHYLECWAKARAAIAKAEGKP